MELYDKVKENKYILKMVVLGDVGVGKSNIIRRIIGQNFEELEATVGVEFTYLDIDDIDQEDPDKKLSIQIWDTCI
jgi:GTPase SAR1 family protein